MYQARNTWPRRCAGWGPLQTPIGSSSTPDTVPDTPTPGLQEPGRQPQAGGDMVQGRSNDWEWWSQGQTLSLGDPSLSRPKRGQRGLHRLARYPNSGTPRTRLSTSGGRCPPTCEVCATVQQPSGVLEWVTEPGPTVVTQRSKTASPKPGRARTSSLSLIAVCGGSCATRALEGSQPEGSLATNAFPSKSASWNLTAHSLHFLLRPVASSATSGMSRNAEQWPRGKITPRPPSRGAPGALCTA